jgi:hypothetical protein
MFQERKSLVVTPVRARQVALQAQALPVLRVQTPVPILRLRQVRFCYLNIFFIEMTIFRVKLANLNLSKKVEKGIPLLCEEG